MGDVDLVAGSRAGVRRIPADLSCPIYFRVKVIGMFITQDARSDSLGLLLSSVSCEYYMQVTTLGTWGPISWRSRASRVARCFIPVINPSRPSSMLAILMGKVVAQSSY
jgi:hypothetical protein